MNLEQITVREAITEAIADHVQRDSILVNDVIEILREATSMALRKCDTIDREIDEADARAIAEWALESSV